MSSILDKILSICEQRPDGNMSSELRLASGVYEISQFSVSFAQGVDQFQEPQTESYGGKMVVSIPQLPDKAILQWAAGSRTVKDGEIVFKNESETTVLRIDFKNAYCIHLRQDQSSGSSCSFTISPEIISLNGVLLNNDWV